MAKARILHLIDTTGPGGAESVFRDLVVELERRGWRSHAVVPHEDWLTEELASRGHRPVLSSYRGIAGVPRHLVRLAGFIKRCSIDLIHSHLWGASIDASLLGVLTGTPVICTLHGRGDISRTERLRGLKFGIVNRGADRIVFVSESLRDYFLEQDPFRPELATVIPNGVDTTLYNADAGNDCDVDSVSARTAFGVPADAHFVVGAVGNLRPVKRYDLLLRAAAILRGRSSEYFFVIVGETPPAIHGELLALRDSLGLRDVVHFTGFRNDVERAFRAFDLFALTSDSEGFSIATVQAMLSGLPIVATRSGGPEEILGPGGTGVLVDRGSPEQLADAIERLRSEPATRAALGRAARREAEARFSLDTQVRSYEALYQTVLTEHRERRRSRRGAH